MTVAGVAALRDLGALETARSIADKHRVTVNAIVGRSLEKYVCRARFELWAILRWTLDLNFSDIGRLFDRNHTTVISGIARYEAEMLKMIEQDLEVATIIEWCKAAQTILDTGYGPNGLTNRQSVIRIGNP